MAVIIWLFDLQLHVQSISAYHHKSCEFEPHPWPGVLDATLSDNVCQLLATGRWFSLGTLVSFTNKTTTMI